MTQSAPDNPREPPQWSSDYFRDAAATPGAAHFGRGLIGHVPVVAALLTVQGALEILFGLFGLGFLLLVQVVPDPDLASMRPLGVMLSVLGVPALLCGVLRIVAGYFNFRYRRRALGMMALGLGLMTMITAYCAPTAIALAVYGLIVYLNEPVIAAFEMGDGGRSTAEIHAAFPALR
jgi:hypothetical protein